MTRGLELSAHPQPPWRGEILGTKLITKGQGFSQLYLCNGTSIKTLNKEVWRASGLGNASMSQEGGAPQTPWEQKLLHLGTFQTSIQLFVCILYNIIYHKLEIVSKTISLGAMKC